MHAGSGAARSTTYSSSCIRIINYHGWSCIVQGEASWGLKGILVDVFILTREREIIIMMVLVAVVYIDKV